MTLWWRSIILWSPSNIIIVWLCSTPVMRIVLGYQLCFTILTWSRCWTHKIMLLRLLSALLLVVWTIMKVIMLILLTALSTSRVRMKNILFTRCSGRMHRWFPTYVLLSFLHILIRHSCLSIRHQYRNWFLRRSVLSVDSESIVIVQVLLSLSRAHAFFSFHIRLRCRNSIETLISSTCWSVRLSSS